MIRKIVIIFFLSLTSLCPEAQPTNTVLLKFTPIWNGKELVLNKFIPLSASDSLAVQTLRFYISSAELLNKGITVWKEDNSYHLVDAEEKKTLSMFLNVPAGLDYNMLRFNLGIDSITNSAGAGGGELDATKGMYWAWQSGYINFKMEGIASNCPARKHEFQFHLGGFRGDDYCMQKITQRIKNKKEFNVLINISEFISGIDLQKKYALMMPGKEAVALSVAAAKIFSIDQ